MEFPSYRSPDAVKTVTANTRCPVQLGQPHVVYFLHPQSNQPQGLPHHASCSDPKESGDPILNVAGGSQTLIPPGARLLLPIFQDSFFCGLPHRFTSRCIWSGFFFFFFFVALRFVSAIDDLGVFVNYRGLLVLGLISALFLLHSKERDKSRKWQPRNCPYPCPSMTFQAIF